ncbi:hypothetical protein SAMN05216285_3907 [Natrinema salifodinae]|uniref:Uncharacterized protein n=1 Tax=Natrinema salifodinae TaxID=1202768 RepID=A0A1I0QV07_9EURY|nr:hypothetical protein SAMN05216285_3907 [Natrinema salifodinae]
MSNFDTWDRYSSEDDRNGGRGPDGSRNGTSSRKQILYIRISHKPDRTIPPSHGRIRQTHYKHTVVNNRRSCRWMTALGRKVAKPAQVDPDRSLPNFRAAISRSTGGRSAVPYGSNEGYSSVFNRSLRQPTGASERDRSNRIVRRRVADRRNPGYSDVLARNRVELSPTVRKPLSSHNAFSMIERGVLERGNPIPSGRTGHHSGSNDREIGSATLDAQSARRERLTALAGELEMCVSTVQFDFPIGPEPEPDQASASASFVIGCGGLPSYSSPICVRQEAPGATTPSPSLDSI